MNEKDALEAYKKELGLRLKAARLTAGIKTQGEAADLLGRSLGEELDHSRVSNYEQGLRLPDPLTMKALAAVYGTTASALYGLDEAVKNQEEQVLLTKYRLTDDRGRVAIQSIAESQPSYKTIIEGGEAPLLNVRKAG